MIFFELFYVFFLIGLFTFGGGYAMIPMIQENVVARGWLSLDELTNFIAISEATPGPFAINIATFIGSTQGGILGSVCATIGVILPSIIIILIVAALFYKVISNKYVRGALDGVKPIVISLILSTALILFIKIIFFSSNNIGSTFAFDRAGLALFIILGISMIMYKKIKKKSVHPIVLILVSAVLGIIVYI